MCFFFFKQKTAYEMRISDCSSDVCSSDLQRPPVDPGLVERLQVIGRNLVAGLDVDAAGRLVDQVVGDIAAEDFLGRQQQAFEAILGGLVGGARADQIGRASGRERGCQDV